MARYLKFWPQTLLALVAGANILLAATSYPGYKTFATEERVFEEKREVLSLSDEFKKEAYCAPQSSFLCAVHSTSLYTAVLVSFIGGLSLLAKKRPRFGVTLLVAFVAPFAIEYASVQVLVQNLKGEAEEKITLAQGNLASPEYLKKEGILTNITEVQKALLTGTVPKLIDRDKAGVILVVLGVSGEGPKTFFEAVVVPFKAYDGFEGELEPVYLFPDNVLAVNALTFETVETFVPILASLALEQELPTLAAKKKEQPKFRLAGEAEYLQIRERKSTEQEEKILAGVELIKQGIGSLEANIAQNEQNYNLNEQNKREQQEKLREWFFSCEASLGAGDSWCLEEQKSWEANVARFDEANAEILQGIEETKGLLGLYRERLGEWQEGYEEFKADPFTPEYEAGAFHPPDEVVVEFTGENVPLVDYLQVAAHEFLHYKSYSLSGVLPAAVDEAITDFLAKKAVTGSFGWGIEYGYLEEVTVLEEILSRVPQEKVIEAYAAKDGRLLEDAVDAAYGKGTYDVLILELSEIGRFPPEDFAGREEKMNEILEFLK